MKRAAVLVAAVVVLVIPSAALAAPASPGLIRDAIARVKHLLPLELYTYNEPIPPAVIASIRCTGTTKRIVCKLSHTGGAIGNEAGNIDTDTVIFRVGHGRLVERNLIPGPAIPVS